MARHSIRKYLRLVFAVALVAVIWCGAALAETSGTCGDNLTWVLDNDGVLTISGTGEMWDYTYQTIYHADNSYSIITTAPWRSAPISVVIEDGATSIGSYAFYNCTSLTSITISDGVTRIGGATFEGCTNLTGITIPGSVTSIGGGAFYGCSNLTGITIPDSVTSIGRSAFSCCTSLTSITIPDGVTSIGVSTFSDCTSLTSITIPNSITSIGNDAFYYCTSLTSITIPDGVTSIGSYAFRNCTSLTSITILDGVTSIGDYAFSNCNAQRYANFNSEGAKTLSKAGYSFRVPGTQYNLRYNYSNNTLTGMEIINVDKDVTSLVIPDCVTSIGSYAFYNCTSLTSITIPSSVTSIGEYAFYNCVSLTSATIPDTITSIDTCAFYQCTSLTNITIPDGVTSIGGSVFYRCTSLSNITIPDGVTSIGYKAFGQCDNLNRVAFTLYDEFTNISYDADMFSGHIPTVYCYMFSAIDSWATSKGFPIVYLDEINIDDIRTITLPNNFRLAVGESRQISAYVFPDDNEVVTWSSSNSSVVSVSKGLVTALDVGVATITATVGGVSSSVTVDTFITATGFELNVTEAWVLAKSPLQLSVASYTPANADADIVWQSSDTSLATVDGNGLVTTIWPGDVIIKAYSEHGVYRICLLHLCYPVTAVALSAPHDVIITDGNLQLTADVTMRTQTCVNHLVTFTSSDEAVATVDAETGLVHGVAVGTSTITATSASGKTASLEISVMEADALTFPTFPANLTTIEEEAFEGTAFQAVVIPDTVTTIGNRAFANCWNLIYVRIPASVTFIADDAFEGCGQVVIDRADE